MYEQQRKTAAGAQSQESVISEETQRERFRETGGAAQG